MVSSASLTLRYANLAPKILVITPNSGAVYTMLSLELKKDGPLGVKAATGIQGMFDGFFQ